MKDRTLLVAEFLATPWAMERTRLTSITETVAGWSLGRPHADDAEGGVDDGRPRQSTWEARRAAAQAMSPDGSIAILPLMGVLVPRANMVTEWCGGTSVMQWVQSFNQLVADSTVSTILIESDSPGGSVYQVPEAAATIMAARAQKRIVSIANSVSASASYWLSSCASECYVTPSGEVGSVGVYQAHDDYSAALAEAGIKRTYVSSGENKVEGAPEMPLSESARAFMQQRCDEYYADFTGSLAKARGIPLAKVLADFGGGRCYGAQGALAAGMVDGICTLPELLSRLASNRPAGAASRRAAAERRLRLAS